MKTNSTVILLLLSIGLFYTFTNAQYQDVKTLRVIASDYKEVLRSASDIIELRDELLIKYNTFPKAEIERMNVVLPDNVNSVRLALDLDGIASRYGISIKNIQVLTGESAGGNLIILPENAIPYERATISFGFISTYANFMRLLAEVERSLRIMDIKSIAFASTDTGLYDFKITVDTYWLK